MGNPSPSYDAPPAMWDHMVLSATQQRVDTPCLTLSRRPSWQQGHRPLPATAHRRPSLAASSHSLVQWSLHCLAFSYGLAVVPYYHWQHRFCFHNLYWHQATCD